MTQLPCDGKEYKFEDCAMEDSNPRSKVSGITSLPLSQFTYTKFGLYLKETKFSVRELTKR